MGALIEEQKIRPDMILSSSAVRAIRTAEAVAEIVWIAETPLVQAGGTLFSNERILH